MDPYDVIVVGGGHAGCEAAAAAAKTARTLMVTESLDSIARIASRPSLGGNREDVIDNLRSLGALMPAVRDRSLVAGCPDTGSLVDADTYAILMKSSLEQVPNLLMRQSIVSEILIRDSRVCGIRSLFDEEFLSDAVVLCTGPIEDDNRILGTLKRLGIGLKKTQALYNIVAFDSTPAVFEHSHIRGLFFAGGILGSGSPELAAESGLRAGLAAAASIHP